MDQLKASNLLIPLNDVTNDYVFVGKAFNTLPDEETHYAKCYIDEFYTWFEEKNDAFIWEHFKQYIA